MADNSMAQNSIIIFPTKGEGSREVERFKITNVDKYYNRGIYTLTCEGEGDDRRSFTVEFQDPKKNHGMSRPQIRDKVNFKETDLLYIDWNTQFELSKKTISQFLTTSQMWALLAININDYFENFVIGKGTFKKTIGVNDNVPEPAFSQVGIGRKLRKRRQSRKKKKSFSHKFSKYKLNILICTHDFYDNPHGYGKNLFLDSYEWLIFLSQI